MVSDIKLLRAEDAALIADRKFSRHAMAAGVGSGKSFLGPIWFHDRVQRVKGLKESKSCILAPTNKLLRHHNLVYYLNLLNDIGWVERKHYRVNKSEIFIEIPHLKHIVFFISAETERRLHSWEFTHFWIDEPGFMSEWVFTYLDQRTRDSQIDVNQGLFTGVSQGATAYFNRFTGEKFRPSEKKYIVDDYSQGKIRTFPRYEIAEPEHNNKGRLVRPGRLIMHSSSYENPNLPDTYIPELYDAYGWNRELWDAHCHGMMIPITEDRAYFEFEEAKHVGDFPPQAHIQTVYLGWDFNPGQVTWTALQQYETKNLVVAENGSRARIVDEACAQFIEKFDPAIWGNHHIVVYGDAAGYFPTERTYGNNYDVIEELLRPHYPHLKILAARANPNVQQRVLGTCRQHKQGRLYADKRCIKVINGWRGVSWDGTGIKKPTHDTLTHAPESVDYILVKLCPIKKPVSGSVSY